MTEHKHAEVLRAIADGKEVQWKSKTSDWDSSPVLDPIIHQHLEWRVKPEPKPKPDVVILHHVSERGYYLQLNPARVPNIKCTFDGETGKLKSAEALE